MEKKSKAPNTTSSAKTPVSAKSKAKPAAKKSGTGTTKKSAQPKVAAPQILEAKPVVAKPVAKKPATRKPVAKKAPAKAAQPITLSSEELTLRAYFVSESRMKLGLPGTPEQDWLEAERQLKAEAQLAR